MIKLARNAALAALAVGFTSSCYGEANEPNEHRPSIVLVHGAFADGSGWRGVYDDLTARGFRVSIVQNPLTSLQDDVQATLRILDRQEGSVILVGHSWGGSVITEAGVHPKVAGLVYVAALAPDAGETTSQQYDGFPAASEFAIDTREDGFGFVDFDRFKAAFAADTSDEDAAFLRDSQVPINMSVFSTPLTQAAWRSRPSWAVIATEDKAFGDGMVLHMAQRIGADITEVPGSHAVFLTRPREVADVIERAAQTVMSGVRE